MWAPSANDSGHSTLSTAEPKWVPYMWTNSLRSDIPPEGTSSNLVVHNPNPNSCPMSHNCDDTNETVVRRIASAPLQYQEVIPRGSSSHPHCSKSSTKKRPKTDLPKNQTPPRIKASVSTISWREELTHFKSSHPQSPQKNKSVNKARSHRSEENHHSKNSDDGKIAKNRASKALSSVDFNGRKEQTSAQSIDEILSSLKTSGTNGILNSNSADLPPQSKTERKSQNEEDEHLSHFMESISAVRKLGNVTRSHMDVTDQSGKDHVVQTKKRCSSENNLTSAQKHDDMHKTSGSRSSSLSGKMRHENISHLVRRSSPKKTEKKSVIEIQDSVKEKKKSYDPKKAREYIKQQRCERLSSIREEKERKKATEEAKKQKLSELDQKRHLLLQANIKKKPPQTLDEKTPVLNTEDLKAPTSVLVPKSSSVPSNVSFRRPTTASTTESGLYVFPGPPHPVVSSGDAKHPVENHPAPRASSDSSAIIIKDIHDMKATIEVLSNTIKNALHSSKSEHAARDKKKAPTVVHLQESSELKIGEKVQEVVKIQPKPLSLDKLGLIKDSFDAAEVHLLTNNLRKMKENFRSVLSQNLNVRPKPKSETKLKSAESDRIDTTLAEKKRLQQWLQKIPAVGLSGSSSEIDKAGNSGFHRRPKRRRTKGNILHTSHQRTHSSSRRLGTSDDSDQENLSGESDQENLSGGPLHHVQSSPRSESDTGNIPEWMKPLTKEPYPVNFMSALKRKMVDKKTEKEAPTSTLAFSSDTANHPQSTPIATNNFSSSNHLNPIYIPPISGNNVSSNSCNERHQLILPTDGLLSTQSTQFYNLFPPKPILAEKSQQTTPKDSLAISPTDDFLDESEKHLTADSSSWSGQIINTAVPPLPRLSSTTTELSSKAANPEVASSVTSTRVSQVPIKPSFIENEKEPLYESDFDEAPADTRKSGEDTDAPSISSTIPENCPDTDSIRLITPNVDLFSKNTEKSDWSSRRDCGDGQHASQECSNVTGKESFEVGRLFNPEAIHLQFQAELNRLDAFNESLYHVMEVEKVRAVTLAREQALLSTKPQTTSEPPPSTSDKAVSIQKSLPASNADISSINYNRGSETPPTEISTVNYARGSEYSGTPPQSLPEVDVAVAKSVSSGSTIKTDIGNTIQTDTVENEVSTESTSSPVGTSQPSSVMEKSPSPRSSDATVSEDIKSPKSPQEASRSPSAKEKGSLKRLKMRQNDKISSDTLSRGNKALSVEDESTEPGTVAHGPDSARSGDPGAVGKTPMERSERRSAIPVNNEDAFKFTLQMLEQLMYEEELRVQHKRTLLKLRERVLCDMAKAECASLDLDKKKLRDIGGQEEQISALRKKQRGVLMKFQQQRDEINLMQKTDELVWKERRLMYLRQLHLFRMQMSTRSHKNRRDEDGSVMPKSVVSSRGITTRRDHDMDNTPDFNALLASASLSSPSITSDLSNPSVPLPVNTSGDTESSCVDERPLQSLKDLELRSRNIRDLDPLRQPVEQLNLWRRRLEDEERQLRDTERHSRHRTLHLKHSLRDRSTSPFQFSEIGSNFGRSSGNIKQRARPISNGSVEEDSSVTEDIPDQHESVLSSVKEVLSGAAASEAYTESFESIESDAKTADSQTGTAEVPTQSNGSKETSVRKESSSTSDNGVKTKQPLLHERSKGHPSVTIKVPLSPRLQRVQRRRYSSGSDDSIVFSQTETGSEQSDIEGRITALTEQLEQRKAEAERLRREAKRTRSERLLAKEQSLQKQLQAYDVYISQARQNLDAELKQTSVPIVRPQIKQPRVASAGKAKSSSPVQQAEQDVSIQDSVAESSASQDSSLDAAALSPSKQNGGDLEFVLPEQSGPKDVIGDAMSSVASGDISEVSSENGSTISNENASLVANMGGKNEVAVKKVGTDVGSDTLSNASSDVASEVATDVLSEMETSACTEIIEDAAKEDAGDTSEHPEEFNEPPAPSSSPVTSENVPLDKEDASDSGDAEDFVEEANVIKVVLKEKEKGDNEKLGSSPEPATEDSVQPQIVDQRTALVNRITDSILQKLLNDCIQTAKIPNKSCDKVKRDKQSQDCEAEKKSKDVRSRVNKILADTIHSPSSRTEPRMQDLMVTTYDILSPEDSPCTSPHQCLPIRQTSDNAEDRDSKVQFQGKPFEGSFGKVSFEGYSSNPASIFNDSYQDWMDEEYRGAAGKEAECLHLQEMQIEQRIQLLNQAIDQIPYLIREIPNKPPPPYTPPGQAPRVLATSVPCSPPLEEIRAVTKSQNEVIQAVTTATNMLYDAHCRKENLKSVIPPKTFLVEGYTVPEHVKLSEQDLQIHKNSARVYRLFLFDLTRQIVEEAYSYEQEEECPAWFQPENVYSKRKARAEAPQSRQELLQLVSRTVLALFGYGPKAEKENLTIRWSRKKRDHVDELLVRELQEEERLWTSYEYDEAVIKNNITESIFEELLIDTTEVVKEIFQRRQRRRSVGRED